MRVKRTFEDGSSATRDTQFFYEHSSWKHRFTKEELDLFVPGNSFKEFVEAQQTALPKLLAGGEALDSG